MMRGMMRGTKALLLVGVFGWLSSSAVTLAEPSRLAKYSMEGLKARLDLRRLMQHPQVEKAYRDEYKSRQRGFVGVGMNVVGHGAMAAAQIPTVPGILEMAQTRPGL